MGLNGPASGIWLAASLAHRLTDPSQTRDTSFALNLQKPLNSRTGRPVDPVLAVIGPEHSSQRAGRPGRCVNWPCRARRFRPKSAAEVGAVRDNAELARAQLAEARSPMVLKQRGPHGPSVPEQRTSTMTSPRRRCWQRSRSISRCVGAEHWLSSTSLQRNSHREPMPKQMCLACS